MGQYVEFSEADGKIYTKIESEYLNIHPKTERGGRQSRLGS